ncbi:MAG: hypothetical protein ACRCYU_01230 [Nocardioides sp.]
MGTQLQIRPIETTDPDQFNSPSLNVFLVDVEYEKTNCPVVAMNRASKAKSEAANLLTAAMWPPVWLPHGTHEWTMITSPGNPEITNAVLPRGYWHPGLGEQEARPETMNHSKGKTIPHNEFVTGRVNLLEDGHQYATDALNDIHGKLRSLPVKQRRRANRALAWMADGTRVAEGDPGRSPSIKTVCHVTGIEAMLPPDPPDRCQSCNQDKYNLTQRVKSFLDQYAGTATSAIYRNKIYQKRSNLVHGARHHTVDRSEPPDPLDDWWSAIIAAGTASAAALNWIRAGAPVVSEPPSVGIARQE